MAEDEMSQDGITNSKDMNLAKFLEIVEDRAWHATVHESQRLDLAGWV